MSAVDVRTISEGDPTVVQVTVGDGADTTSHEVAVSGTDLDRLGRPGESAEQLVARCFDFLLEREPKESILASFDVADISKYWPEFEQAITGERGH